MTPVRRIRHEEDGAVFALVAVMAMSLLLISAFVIDVGNWFEHDRHLQLQVDAGALAAGQEFTGCAQDATDTNGRIERVAHKYAGDPDLATLFPAFFTDGDRLNLQVDDPDRVSLRLNSDSYPTGGQDFLMDWRSPGDPPLGPFTPDGVAESALPCETKFLDVKATDVGIPTFFGAVPDLSVVDVKANARVEIREVESLSGFLPWAIPETDPKHVAVVFMNEGNGQKETAFELVRGATQQLNGTLLQLWNGANTVPLSTQNGVIVVTSRLGSAAGDPAFDITGSLAAICSQAKTKCYSGSTPTSGLVFVRANENPAGGTPTAPKLGSVQLLPGTCPGDSSPYFLLIDASCHVNIEAEVNFGVANPQNPPTRARVWADGPGCNRELSFSAGMLWTGSCRNITDGSGQNPITIRWEADDPSQGGNATVGGTFPVTVARPYASDDASEPIQYVVVSPNPTGGGGPAVPVSVSVGIPPSLQVASTPPYLDDAFLLRFKKRNSSATQQIDCDADNLPDPIGYPPANGLPPDVKEVAYGCQTTYGVDHDEICPPEYDQASELPPNVTEPTPIPTCARVRPGQVASLRKGIEYRWENPDQPYGACPANNWPQADGDPIPGPDDPRWVILIVTEYSAFQAPPGQDPVVPITKFAGFYVTGWDIQGNATTGCPGENDPHPLGFGSSQDNGDVWGHFITSVPFIPGATPSESFCNFNEIGVCVAILTR